MSPFGKPFEFVAATEFAADPAGGGGTLNLSLQSLTLDPGSWTEPQEPVGDPFVIQGIEVHPDGSFVTPNVAFELVGEAVLFPDVGEDA